MKTLSVYPKQILIGKNDNRSIYLTAPSWDCGWYWGFGYLGNKDSHYHIDTLGKGKVLFEAFKNHFGDTLVVRESQLWTLCELFQTFYDLKNTAEVLGRGGSHYTYNPCKDIITNKQEVERINTIVLPHIFEEIYKILIPAQNNTKIDAELVALNNEGDTSKVVAFMIEKGITTNDLKNVKGITSHDYNIIHSAFWKFIHSKKN